MKMSKANEVIELHFPITGTVVPSDHAYALFGALSNIVPEIHDANWLGIHHINGLASRGDGLSVVLPEAKLRLRLPADKIETVYKIAGKQLIVNDCRLECGPPTISILRPSPKLRAKIVIIKTAKAKSDLHICDFISSVRKQMHSMELTASAEIEQDINTSGSFRKRVVRVSGISLIGYSVVVTGLTTEHSLILQEHGIGGRRKFGCGLFVPIREESDVQSYRDIKNVINDENKLNVNG